MGHEVRITQKGRPSDYVNSIRREIRKKSGSQSIEFCLSGLEGAMLVVCDTAQLLVQSDIATIQQIETGRTLVQSRYDYSTVSKKLLRIVMITRRVDVSSA